MRRIKSGHVFSLLLVATMLVPTSVVLAEESAPQDAANLLENPGFEGDYVGHDSIGDVKTAPDWTPSLSPRRRV